MYNELRLSVASCNEHVIYIMICGHQLYHSERACSLIVARASVAPDVLDSTPHESEYLVVGDVSVFKDAHRGRVCVCVHRGVSVRALF